MSFLVFKSAILYIVMVAVVLVVPARMYFGQVVVVDDNAKVYVTISCLGDWTRSHSALHTRHTKMSEAYWLRYEAYTCDTKALWRNISSSKGES
jgi:hypothetical protein